MGTLPPGGSREVASAPRVRQDQRQDGPTPTSPNPRSPVSPWPGYLGNDTSHEGCSGFSGGVLPGEPQNSSWSVSHSEEKLASSWSQQDKARVAELLVNLQELLGCGVGSDFILCAQLVTQCLHLSKQFLMIGMNLV